MTTTSIGLTCVSSDSALTFTYTVNNLSSGANGKYALFYYLDDYQTSTSAAQFNIINGQGIIPTADGLNLYPPVGCVGSYNIASGNGYALSTENGVCTVNASHSTTITDPWNVNSESKGTLKFTGLTNGQSYMLEIVIIDTSDDAIVSSVSINGANAYKQFGSTYTTTGSGAASAITYSSKGFELNAVTTPTPMLIIPTAAPLKPSIQKIGGTSTSINFNVVWGAYRGTPITKIIVSYKNKTDSSFSRRVITVTPNNASRLDGPSFYNVQDLVGLVANGVYDIIVQTHNTAGYSPQSDCFTTYLDDVIPSVTDAHLDVDTSAIGKFSVTFTVPVECYQSLDVAYPTNTKYLTSASVITPAAYRYLKTPTSYLDSQSALIYNQDGLVKYIFTTQIKDAATGTVILSEDFRPTYDYTSQPPVLISPTFGVYSITRKFQLPDSQLAFINKSVIASIVVKADITNDPTSYSPAAETSSVSLSGNFFISNSNVASKFAYSASVNKVVTTFTSLNLSVNLANALNYNLNEDLLAYGASLSDSTQTTTVSLQTTGAFNFRVIDANSLTTTILSGTFNTSASATNPTATASTLSTNDLINGITIPIIPSGNGKVGITQLCLNLVFTINENGNIISNNATTNWVNLNAGQSLLMPADALKLGDVLLETASLANKNVLRLSFPPYKNGDAGLFGGKLVGYRYYYAVQDNFGNWQYSAYPNIIAASEVKQIINVNQNGSPLNVGTYKYAISAITAINANETNQANWVVGDIAQSNQTNFIANFISDITFPSNHIVFSPIDEAGKYTATVKWINGSMPSGQNFNATNKYVPSNGTAIESEVTSTSTFAYDTNSLSSKSWINSNICTIIRDQSTNDYATSLVSQGAYYNNATGTTPYSAINGKVWPTGATATKGTDTTTSTTRKSNDTILASLSAPNYSTAARTVPSSAAVASAIAASTVASYSAAKGASLLSISNNLISPPQGSSYSLSDWTSTPYTYSVSNFNLQDTKDLIWKYTTNAGNSYAVAGTFQLNTLTDGTFTTRTDFPTATTPLNSLNAYYYDASFNPATTTSGNAAGQLSLMSGQNLVYLYSGTNNRWYNTRSLISYITPTTGANAGLILPPLAAGSGWKILTITYNSSGNAVTAGTWVDFILSAAQIARLFPLNTTASIGTSVPYTPTAPTANNWDLVSVGNLNIMYIPNLVPGQVLNLSLVNHVYDATITTVNGTSTTTRNIYQSAETVIQVIPSSTPSISTNSRLLYYYDANNNNLGSSTVITPTERARASKCKFQCNVTPNGSLLKNWTVIAPPLDSNKTPLTVAATTFSGTFSWPARNEDYAFTIDIPYAVGGIILMASNTQGLVTITFPSIGYFQ